MTKVNRKKMPDWYLWLKESMFDRKGTQFKSQRWDFCQFDIRFLIDRTCGNW